MNTKLLRQKILDLTIRGKLTEQKKSDGTTKDLLEQIQGERTGEALQTRKASTCHCEAQKRRGNLKQSKSASPKEIIPLDKSEAPFEIPENWEWVRLGDVCELQSGFTIPSEQECESGKMMYIKVSDMNLPENLIEIQTSQRYVNEWKESQVIKPGSIIFPKRGGAILTNKKRIVKIPILADLNIMGINPKTSFDYIYYWFLNVDLASLNNGSNIPQVNNKDIDPLWLPLPPLAEQQRIVTAIENAFAEITEIENNQELLKKHIKQGRQKILDLAIRGKLTQQLKTDGTTKDLLKQISSNVILSNAKNPAETVKSSHVILSKRSASKDLAKEIIPLDKTTAPFEIPSTWEWVRLGDLSEKIQYGYNAPAKDCGRIKMVRISDIHENAVDWDSVPYCDIEESEIQTYLLKKNDILFARTGGTVGKSFIVNEVPEESVYAGYLIRTRYGENINAQYMKYFMESNLYWEQLRDGCIATAQPNCNGQTLGKMKIPLPPLAEQQRIVATIEQSFAEFDAMEVNL